jgi:hypothetical protein
MLLATLVLTLLLERALEKNSTLQKLVLIARPRSTIIGKYKYVTTKTIIKKM